MAARKMETIDEIRPNVFEAIKRAFIKRGVVPRGRLRAAEVPPIQDQSAAAADKSSASAKTKPSSDSDETYLEKVAEGESDEKIEASDDEGANLDKLKSETEGSKSAKGPEELAELTEKSLDVLYEATTVFPFTLFPDTLTLDREKLTIANRHFWQSATITSVPV
ncbi:MAG TPA: hypothetical protein VFK97_00560, partial [Candidatus Saccharimonadales bacterium]|nr:hypothetical protein [Candidatus Saccharimonadales bacterium]